MSPAARVLLVRPSCFGFNEDTATTNSYQCRLEDAAVQQRAAAEFDGALRALDRAQIDYIVLDDSPDPKTPDSIFPNNCVSTHVRADQENQPAAHAVVLYPMCGANRRLERQLGFAERLCVDGAELIDLTGYEAEGKFLEGTGSMVLDRDAGICYAALSPRTHPDVLRDWCSRFGYELVAFEARRSSNNELLYHTNVLMSVGPDYVAICLEMIPDEAARQRVAEAIERKSRKQLWRLTEAQIDQFAGNMLTLQTRDGRTATVLSRTAQNALQSDPLFARFCTHPCVLDIPTIEAVGGGSARCMLAELFF